MMSKGALFSRREGLRALPTEKVMGLRMLLLTRRFPEEEVSKCLSFPRASMPRNAIFVYSPMRALSMALDERSIAVIENS